MAWAFGVLHWAPGAFWAATPHELMAAIEGYMDAHGGGRDQPMSRAELGDLMRRYPDNNPTRVASAPAAPNSKP